MPTMIRMSRCAQLALLLSSFTSAEEKGDLMAPLLLGAMGGRCLGPGEASDVLHLHQAYVDGSNLNGVGPDKEKPEELRLVNVSTSKTGLQIDAIVTASDTYDAAQSGATASKNGIVNGFFQVNMRGGTVKKPGKGGFDGRTQAEFSIRFIEAISQKDYVMEDILFSFYDLDQAKQKINTECVAWDANANSTLITTANTELVENPLAGGMVEYCSTTTGTGDDNPTDPKSITQQQADRTGVVIGKDVNTFRFNYSIAFGKTESGRNLMMSIDNPIQRCPEPPACCPEPASDGMCSYVPWRSGDSS